MTLSSAGAWCAVTRPWMTEVWSRDCISYQSSDDVGIMSRVFYWVLFWDCCWWCNVVIRQWQGLEADQPSGRPFTPFCSQLLSELGMLLITGHRHLATSWHMSAVSTQWETRPVHCGIFGANRRTFNYGANINIVDSSLSKVLLSRLRVVLTFLNMHFTHFSWRKAPEIIKKWPQENMRIVSAWFPIVHCWGRCWHSAL